MESAVEQTMLWTVLEQANERVLKVVYTKASKSKLDLLIKTIWSRAKPIKPDATYTSVCVLYQHFRSAKISK